MSHHDAAPGSGLRSPRGSAGFGLSIIAALVLSACSLFEPPPNIAGFPPPPPAPGPAPALPRPEPQTRAGVQAEMVRWFRHKGYQEPQVGALIDYARMESNFNPCITNGSRYKYTFQWSADRLDRLAQFAHTRSCPPLEKQLAFADWELRNNSNYSCFFAATTRSSALTALRRGFGYGRC